MKIIGYCSTSTYSQDIQKQKKLILDAYPNASIMMDHRNHETDGLYDNKWDRLVAFNRLFVDRLVMDSVTRMKCEPEKVAQCYEKFYSNGVELEFLREPELNSSVFRKIEDEIDDMEVSEDDKYVFRDLLKKLRKKQIDMVIELSLSDREKRSMLAKNSIEIAREKGKKVGREKGMKVKSLKEGPAKEIILCHDRRFVQREGFIEQWLPQRIMKEAGISRPTYKKYLKELIQEDIKRKLSNRYGKGGQRT